MIVVSVCVVFGVVIKVGKVIVSPSHVSRNKKKIIAASFIREHSTHEQKQFVSARSGFVRA